MDALGPARLGQLRPVAPVRRHDGLRRERQDRRSPTGPPTARPAPRSTPTKELLGTATWPAAPASGGPTPSDTGIYGATGYGSSYIFQRRVLAKTQPLYGGSLKISALRAPNAPQSYFASEQIVDELAHAADMDPIAFRKLNIDGTTPARSPLARRCWTPRRSRPAGSRRSPRSNLQSGNVVTGRGIGMGTFASSQVGVVADIEVNKKTGKILVKHLYIAQNNGITISPYARHEPDERRRDPGSLARDVGAGRPGTRTGSRASTGSRTRSCASRTPEGDAGQRAPERVRHGRPRAT